MFNTDKLQNELNKAGISQAELDNRIGVAGGMVSKYVRGVRTPTPETLYRFLRALGWTDKDIKNERLVDWYFLNGS